MTLAPMPAMTAVTAAHASVAADAMVEAAALASIVQRIGGAIDAVGVVVTLAQSSGTCVRGLALLAAASIPGRGRRRVPAAPPRT